MYDRYCIQVQYCTVLLPKYYCTVQLTTSTRPLIQYCTRNEITFANFANVIFVVLVTQIQYDEYCTIPLQHHFKMVQYSRAVHKYVRIKLLRAYWRIR